ncbi:hypothetical protein [Amycolatopsis sp. DG1A-15b]|uniref:hypothetical protein n=1 Tax=Amycolatopsis sp. DG1A-15b TaxID=3052846 RepID=UPI00255BF460|nr:hypothetical protein [Amycolatopsis sp. DG1A-15b]WIX91658.1 hypothetical protein QRY02_14970 [Amycolatopsis sp. DG1A-15b]
MGRHYRDEEPVPHPQDRTPSVPPEGRSEASGAFRTPGRSSISDAFGIAGRGSAARTPGESSGSVFFTEGAEAPGFPPESGVAHPAARRGEASGSHPVAGARRGEASGSYPVAGRGESTVTRAPRRGEASGSYPVAGGDSAVTQAPRRGEASGAHPVTSSEITTTLARRGEASGAYPVAHGETTAARAGRRGEASGAYPVAHAETATGRRGDTSGTHPAPSETSPGRGGISGAHPAASETATGRRGDTSGTHPAADSETTAAYATAGSTGTPARSRRKGGGRSAPDRTEAPGSGRSTRASRRAGASGAHPIAAPAGAPGASLAAPGANPAAPAAAPGAFPAGSPAPRSRRKGGKAADRHPESAAERTEVIARPDDDLAARGEAPGTSRTLDRGDDTGARAPERGESTERSDNTGPDRAGRSDSTGPHRAGRGEGTGSHRIVGKSDATGSHRIVGKKAPRRRIAGWPIACFVLAVLIGLGIVGWNWADNELNSRAEAQAASCDGGTSHMRIVVTPSVQKPVTAAAERWNQAATVVHGQCVHVMIEAKASAQVLDALVGRAKMDSIGGLPAAWLPESSYWVSELTTKKPEMIGSPAQSVANARSADYPFIGLAGPGIDDTALRAAQTFREYLEQPAQQADFAAAGIKST